jgi:hypothetical protein
VLEQVLLEGINVEVAGEVEKLCVPVDADQADLHA